MRERQEWEVTEIAVPDVKARKACEILREDPRAVLLDVRTEPEWDFVGVPLTGNYYQVEWRTYPDMGVNPDFLAEVRALGVAPDAPILLLCRTGIRSREAGAFLLQNGYMDCSNILEGFEGARDEKGRRRCVNGWIAEGLPWIQC